MLGRMNALRATLHEPGAAAAPQRLRLVGCVSVRARMHAAHNAFCSGLRVDCDVVPGYTLLRGVDPGPPSIARAAQGLQGANLPQHFGYVCTEFGSNCGAFTSDGWFRGSRLRPTSQWVQHSIRAMEGQPPCFGAYIKGRLDDITGVCHAAQPHLGGPPHSGAFWAPAFVPTHPLCLLPVLHCRTSAPWLTSRPRCIANRRLPRHPRLCLLCRPRCICRRSRGAAAAPGAVAAATTPPRS